MKNWERKTITFKHW